MIKFTVTDDLHYVNATVCVMPIYEDIMAVEQSLVHLSCIAFCDGGKVKLAELHTVVPCLFGTWYDISIRVNKIAVLDFISNSNGYIANFKTIGQRNYYIVPTGKRCPLCGKIHYGEITGKPMRYCDNNAIVRPDIMLFDVPIATDKIILI